MIKYSAIIKTAMIILFITSSDVLYSHGVEYKISKNKVYTVSMNYSDGEIMNYTNYKIYSPGSESVFQSGLTDKNGKISFIPDAAGEWKVDVNDDTGHAASVIVKAGQVSDVSIASGNSLNIFQKIIMAICVIWGAAGTALYFRSRKVS
ncbi:MAG TPA: hypothetical protein PK293_16895 [Spirochaetota bacterium]|nr:hypothetical protein [Spirochaetota bacterium]